VLLVQGTETPGEANYSLTRGNFEYRFASPENKAKFEKEPGRYEVQLNGMCAYMGAPVLGNPERFAVYEGRIYVFGTESCRKEFFADPVKYLKR
jgi:YHS domain-containing protein